MKDQGKITQNDNMPGVPDDIPQFPEDRIDETSDYNWLVIPAFAMAFGFWWFVWMLVRFLMDKC